MTATIKLITALVLFPVVAGLAATTPPKAKPVIFGTSDYSNILFGKVQRAASLFGPNLGQPFAVLSQGDSLQKLDKCLWSKFCMANSGPAGIEEESDIKLPLTSWIPQGNLKDTLIFVDAASSANSNAGGNPFASLFPFQQKKKQNTPSQTTTMQSKVQEINKELLRVAVERKCAHVYVLSDNSSLASCIATLQEYCVAKKVPCTILALEPTAILDTTVGWTSSRPQDMQGELTGPIELQSWSVDSTAEEAVDGTSTFSAEDAAEVMLQVALRADRSPEQLLRVVRLKSGGELTERMNADYFTLVGGKKAKARAGTVLSVSSWESVLSPSFGPVLGALGQKPSQ